MPMTQRDQAVTLSDIHDGDRPCADPHVSIVLVNWNGRRDTLECLEAVFRLSYPNFSIIVCDNNSSDESVEAIEAWARDEVEVVPQSEWFAPRMQSPQRMAKVPCVVLTRAEAEGLSAPPADSRLFVIRTGGNLGFAGGNNVGLAFAMRCLRSAYAWLLNTDTFPDRLALSELVDRASQGRDLGMVGSSLVYYWRPTTVQAFGGARMDQETTEISHIGEGGAIKSIPSDPQPIEAQTAYVVGASMLVTRAFLLDVGLMTEAYFLYYEEFDWAKRMAGRYVVGYAPRSIVYHKAGGSSRRVASLVAERYMWRNRIRFFSRFMPDRLGRNVRYMLGHGLRSLAKGRFALAGVVFKAVLDLRQLRSEGQRLMPGPSIALHGDD